jgi:hypothetical protein
MFVCRDLRIEFDAEQRAKIGPEVGAWVEEMQGRGVRLQGDVLAPAQETRTVRVRDGEVQIATGPLAETHEPISGFNILECGSLDEALEVSAKHPIARFGTIELRPLRRVEASSGSLAMTCPG